MKIDPTRLLVLIALGLSIREIALEFGCSQQWVDYYCKRHGVITPREFKRRQALRAAALRLTRFHRATKECPKCGEVKFLDEFTLARGRQRYSYCKKCVAAEHRERYRSDPVYREKAKSFQREHPERSRAYSAKWYAAHREEQAGLRRERYHSDPVYRERVLAASRESNRRKKAALLEARPAPKE